MYNSGSKVQVKNMLALSLDNFPPGNINQILELISLYTLWAMCLMWLCTIQLVAEMFSSRDTS